MIDSSLPIHELPSMMARVLQLRVEGKSLKDAGEILSLSTLRVQQIEIKAIRRLRRFGHKGLTLTELRDSHRKNGHFLFNGKLENEWRIYWRWDFGEWEVHIRRALLGRERKPKKLMKLRLPDFADVANKVESLSVQDTQILILFLYRNSVYKHELNKKLKSMNISWKEMVNRSVQIIREVRLIDVGFVASKIDTPWKHVNLNLVDPIAYSERILLSITGIRLPDYKRSLWAVGIEPPNKVDKGNIEYSIEDELIG